MKAQTYKKGALKYRKNGKCATINLEAKEK